MEGHLEGRDILKQGLIKRIGSGKSTKIWDKNWLPREEMMRPYGSLIQNLPTYVLHLIDATSSWWNRQRLGQVFFSFDASVIMSMPLCTMDVTEFWCWNYEKNGMFSVKSAYKMLVATRQRGEA